MSIGIVEHETTLPKVALAPALSRFAPQDVKRSEEMASSEITRFI
jgi:hypothetical protein